MQEVEMGLFKPNLDKMKSNQDVKGLLRTLANKDEPTRIAAVQALGEIKGASAVKALTKLCNNTSEKELVRIAAVEALGSIGDTDVTELIIHLFKNENENPDIRIAAAHALSENPDSKIIQILVNALGDKNWSVRWGVMTPIIKIGAQTVEALVQSLYNKDFSVREKAVRILGNIGDSRVIAYLVNCLKDDNENVREAAYRALKKLRHESSPVIPRKVTKSDKHQASTLRCQSCGLPLVHAYKDRFYCDNRDCALFGHIVT